MSDTHILGLDPDSKKCGWAVLNQRGEFVAGGIIKNKVALTRIIETTHPDYIFVEDVPQVGGNVHTIKVIAYAIGKILQQLEDLGYTEPPKFVTPTAWRKALGLSGKASKQEIKDAVLEQYEVRDDYLQDVYDACGIAAWGLNETSAVLSQDIEPIA
jgi:Holliday junction resolvasome RuvABC endonuclease subunit